MLLDSAYLQQIVQHLLYSMPLLLLLYFQRPSLRSVTVYLFLVNYFIMGKIKEKLCSSSLGIVA